MWENSGFFSKPPGNHGSNNICDGKRKILTKMILLQ